MFLQTKNEKIGKTMVNDLMTLGHCLFISLRFLLNLKHSCDRYFIAAMTEWPLKVKPLDNCCYATGNSLHGNSTVCGRNDMCRSAVLRIRPNTSSSSGLQAAKDITSQVDVNNE